MEKPEIIRSSLTQCIGTSQYWKVFPGNFRFYITDGVKIMYEMCESLWLISAIFFELSFYGSPEMMKKKAKEVFDLADKVKKSGDQTAA